MTKFFVGNGNGGALMHGLYGVDLVCACPRLARIAIRNKLNVILTESTVLFDLMDCMVFRGVSDL